MKYFKSVLFNKLILIILLIFTTLKITNQIDWSWIWVLSPIWIPSAITIIAGVTLGLIIVSLMICGLSSDNIINALNFSLRKMKLKVTNLFNRNRF